MSIEICSIGKTYITRHSRTEAVKRISLSIGDGEFACLLGPSGCGKTTLLNIIAGLEKASEGQVLVNGKPVLGPGTDRAVLFQEAALFPWLTVMENVEFGLKILGVCREERRRTAEKFLSLVHMDKSAYVYVHELSGGMKQRVALARALALDSDIMIMDEPFSALDMHTRNVLQDELLHIWQETGKTILFVTHSVEEAVYLADRIIVMNGSPGEIKKLLEVNIERPRRRDDKAYVSLLADISEGMKDGVGDCEKVETRII